MNLSQRLNTLTKSPNTHTTQEAGGGWVGSHLDSVEAGPGINDNGSGSSVNLALALALAKSKIFPKNELIFGWWGGEEEVVYDISECLLVSISIVDPTVDPNPLHFGTEPPSPRVRD